MTLRLTPSEIRFRVVVLQKRISHETWEGIETTADRDKLGQLDVDQGGSAQKEGALMV